MWRCFTDLPANWQRPELVLSLEDVALDAVLEINDAEIAKDDDLDDIISHLNKLFQKDSTIT